jgi:hypothetical protein
MSYIVGETLKAGDCVGVDPKTGKLVKLSNEAGAIGHLIATAARDFREGDKVTRIGRYPEPGLIDRPELIEADYF